jgi:O-antigen/teichoic acid export membrane protein
MQQFSRVVARNSAFGMAAQLVIKVLSFGFSILIVRNLGAEDYGQYAAVLAFGALFVFIADLGLSPYAVRQVARWRDAPDGLERANALSGNLLMLRFLLALLAATLLIATAWLTDRPPIMIGAIALGTLGLIMYSVHGTSDAMLAGFERLDLSAGAKVLYQIVFVLVGALVLLLGAGYYGLIGANLLGIALMTAACWRGARWLGLRPGRANPAGWPALLRASMPFGVIGFTLGLSYKFDSVLLNIFRGDTETGYYNAAYNLVFATAVLSNVMNTALYPSLTRQAATGPEALPAIYARTLRYLMLLALPIAIGGAALADQIVPFLFKATYLPAVPALQIVICVVPLMYCSEFLGYIVLIRGKERSAARAIVTSTSVNVILNLILVPIFGFVGAAIMTVVTEAILVGQYIWMLRAEMRQLDWGNIVLRPLLAGLVMGGTVLALRFLPLLLNIALGALIYAALLVLLGVVGRDELRFVRNLRGSAEVVS